LFFLETLVVLINSFQSSINTFDVRHLSKNPN
jgi:hypothetical protein